MCRRHGTSAPFRGSSSHRARLVRFFLQSRQHRGAARSIFLFFLVLFRLVAFFVHIQLGVQLCKPCGFLCQLFLLWKGLLHFDLCRRLLLMQGGQFVFCGGDALREVVQRIIQTDDTAKRVFAQCYRVFPLTFQKSLIFAVVGVEPQRQFKAAITADHFFLTVRQLGASEKKPLASSLFFIVSHAPDGYAAESLLHLWVCGGKFGIRFHASNIGGGFLNVSRELCEQLIFQTELLALMVGFQHLEFCDLNIQIHLRVPCR